MGTPLFYPEMCERKFTLSRQIRLRVLDADQASRLRDALSAVADALGGDDAFLACTGGDGEGRSEDEPGGSG